MSEATHGSRNSPLIGILMLDTTFPRIKGDIGNPQTFSFPVVYQKVHGASVQRLVIEADPGLVHDFIAAGKILVAKGVNAIATSCGFLALFHRHLVEALPVPVFSSSLLQVHLAQALIRRNQKIGIITARRSSLTDAHLAGVGIQHYPTAIIGMEHAREFSAVFIGGKETLDQGQCHQEMQATAEQLLHEHPDVGIIVLECTNMPPFADTVRRATGLPVFDVVTMVNHAHSLLMSG
jgi:Asp/Glu/hydantoin racemase